MAIVRSVASCAVVLPLVLWVAPLRATPIETVPGYYLEEVQTRQSVDGRGQQQTLRSWIALGKLRKEDGRTITIVRTDRGVVWVLDPRASTYFEVDEASISSIGQQSMAALGTDGENPATWLSRTGREKQVGRWNAYEVRVEDRPLPGVTLSIWLSRDVAIDKTVRDSIIGKMFDSGAGQLLTGLRDLEGYPVEIEVTVRLGRQSIGLQHRVTRVESLDVEVDRFSVPSTYDKVASPFEPSEAAPTSGDAPTP